MWHSVWYCCLLTGWEAAQQAEWISVLPGQANTNVERPRHSKQLLACSASEGGAGLMWLLDRPTQNMAYA